MSQTYFSKFPLINYKGQTAVNISERVSLLDTVAKNPYLYYTYDINNDIRQDQVAGAYYSDSYMAWLVCLSNKIIDPYYGWYLSETDFNSLLIAKYGSILTAQETILFYRNNWYDNMESIEVGYYDALPANLTKYFTPVFGYNGKIIAYSRVQEDWIINTNQVITIHDIGGGTFIKGEIISISFPDLNENGEATVVYSDDTSLSIQHISGYSVPTSDTCMIFYGRTSGNVVTVLSSDNLTIKVFSNVPDDEMVYYSPVYAYDLAREKNEKNKSIKLLNNSFSTQVSVELTKLLAK